MDSDVHILANTHARMHMHRYIHAHAHICTHAQKHIYIYTNMFLHSHRKHRVRTHKQVKPVRKQVKPRQYMDILGCLQKQVDLGNLHFGRGRLSGPNTGKGWQEGTVFKHNFGIW